MHLIGQRKIHHKRSEPQNNKIHAESNQPPFPYGSQIVVPEECSVTVLHQIL